MLPNEDSRPAPKLKVVPPSQIPSAEPRIPIPSAPTTPMAPTTNQSSTPATSNQSLIRKVTIGAIAIGFVLVGFIRTPFEVGGTVKLEMPEGSREIIRIPRAAMVTDIKVKSGQYVKKGETLAYLSSLESKQEIASVETQLNQARQGLDAAQKKKVAADAQLLEKSASLKTANFKAIREGNRAMDNANGQYTSKIRMLNTQLQNFIDQIPKLEEKFQRYQDLRKEGAISQDKVDEVRDSLDNIRNNIQTKTEEIASAAQLQIDEADDLAIQRDFQLASLQASSLAAAAEADMKAQEKAIADLEKRLLDLKISEQALTTLRSPIDGVVITSDLDLKKNQQLKPGDDFLKISDLRNLTGTVEVREEDSRYVDQNKPVTFRSRQDKLRDYQATVIDKLPEIKNDPSQSQGMLQVRLLVDNSDGELKPGTNGYAKIFSENISLYEHLGRELMRLIPLERLLWGERDNKESTSSHRISSLPVSMD